jgi:hypothetical protein
MANGETHPMSVTGTENRIRIERNEPAMTAASSASTAFAASRSTGLEASGTRPAVKAAQTMMR